MTSGKRERDAALEPVRGAFEQFGRDDALYAALSRGGREGGRWNPDEFFANGRERIAEVMAYATSLGLELRRDHALDFGTGPGRLAQGLAEHFARVTGVDIASSMVETARAYNTHGERVEYVVNTAPDLHIFDSATFDLVYTEKVLQHIPPDLQAGYIAEFVRVLRPGGLAIFQTRNGPLIRQGSLRSFLYTLNRRHVRRLLQRLRGKHPYEMHFIARERVEEIVSAAGGRIVDVVDLSRGKPNRSLRYCVLKET